MLKITVVTPCFNQSETIEDTLTSVLSQGYPNLEYIVIDGGSTDGSARIIERFQDRLTYWCSEPDDGHYAAVNKGLGFGTGEVMCWLNGDDFLLPGALNTVGSIFTQLSEVEWLTTMAPVTADASGSCIGAISIPGFSREAFLDGVYLPGAGSHFFGFIQQESTFWRRSLWERSGPINTSFEYAGDFDLWSRFFRNSAVLFGTSCPLGCFRFQEKQRSAMCLDKYLTEAGHSLAQLRKDLNWKLNFKRQLIARRWLRFLPLPKIFPSTYYHAFGVVRRRRGQPTRTWEVKPFRFFTAPQEFIPHHPD